MGKMTKYSDLKTDDVFNWGSSTYIWLGDTMRSIMCISGPDRRQDSRNIYTNALPKYHNDINGVETEIEWEVIGRMGFIGVETESYYADEPKL